MNRRVLVACLALSTLAASAALAGSLEPPKEGKQDTRNSKAADSKRVGDPYPLSTCPISGANLGSMGDPVVKVYEGREIRFCCKGCPPKFEKDLAKTMAAVDESITKDQAARYPLKTSLVTGKDLPEKPFEFVYGNRLIRLGSESEKAEFLKDPKKYFASLDQAVIAAQKPDYPLKTCPVSNEQLGGDMGEPVDMVIGGRLIRICCKSCRKDVEKEPAKFIAMVDEARRSAQPAPAEPKPTEKKEPEPTKPK